MEPVKGGTLANLPEKVENMFKSYNPQMSIPSWAIRFTASQPNVMLVLSGMSNMQQMQDNTAFMKEFTPLNDEELKIIKEAVDIINSNIVIPCTGCSYCTDGCPQNIAIPKYFSLYNAEMQELKGKFWTPQAEYYDRLTAVHFNTFTIADNKIFSFFAEKIKYKIPVKIHAGHPIVR